MPTEIITNCRECNQNQADVCVLAALFDLISEDSALNEDQKQQQRCLARSNFAGKPCPPPQEPSTKEFIAQTDQSILSLYPA